MDWETESTMQSVIETDFADQTVIAVVHRFRFIDRFDRVVLLKHGCLVENGDPISLLAADSEFRKLYLAWKKE
jgi:ABC-type multidrug transport system fused ATPase/permease subunit